MVFWQVWSRIVWRGVRWGLGGVCVAGLIGLIGLTATAAPGLPPPTQEAEGQPTAAMRAFLADRQLPENRPPLALTPCVDGMAGPYPCQNVDLLAYLPLSTFAASAGNDSWGWRDPQTGHEYALMGLNNGTGFVDISDPENPLYLGKLPTHTTSSSWRDIKVYANHAFIVSEASGHGMQVFDLTQLRSVIAPPVTFAETAHYGNFGNAHNLVINEASGYAYAVGSNTCAGGLHMVNIQIPTSPSYAGCFSADGYTHDAQCVNYAGPDPDYQGREICFNSNEDTLTIVNVSNKANPVQVSRTGYLGSSYTHQGWLTEDQRYFLLDDEGDETTFGHNTRTYIWDVANLDAPLLMGNYTAAVAAIDHNQYVHGDYAYQANYRAGLRILDITAVAGASLSEAAYFDIYPASNSASFNGAWSTFPYYESGVVIISGIEQGLFVVRPTLAPDFDLRTTDGQLAVCGSGMDSTTIDLVGRNGYSGLVSLSAPGWPVGLSAAFNPNPAPAPGSSLATVTVDAGVAAAVYDLTVEGSDGVLSDSLGVSLQVADGVPGAPGLLTPPDGANNQLIQPVFTWGAASQAAQYIIEIAGDAAFQDVVDTATVQATTYTAATALQPSTLYYWRVSADNVCGSGPVSAVFSFTTRAVPPILLVDDDDNAPDVRTFYTALLDGLGQAYDIWDTANSDDEPDQAALSPYATVIWFSGDEFGGAAGPGSGGEAALAAWLDGGRCLFISSQDYYYDRGLTPFMGDYLGLAQATSDVSQVVVTGQGSLFSGYGPYTLVYPFTNYSDRLVPTAAAETAFSGNAGSAALLKDGGLYRTLFWGFPLEAIPTLTERQTLLDVILTWCQTPGSTGELTGMVSNADDGAPLSGAVVTADDGATQYSAVSGGDGMYSLTLPAGVYSVSAAHDGFFGQMVTGVSVTEGATTTQDFSLTPMTPGLELTFTLSAGTTCGAANSLTALIGTAVTYCYQASNTGNMTLTTHSLTDDGLGQLLAGLAYDLTPGASVTYTTTRPALTSMTHQAIWTGSAGPVSASATAAATLEVIAPGGEFSADTILSGAPGTTVTHTFTLTNTGTHTDSFDLSLQGATWPTQLSPTMTPPLAPGDALQVTAAVSIPPAPGRGVVIGADDFALQAVSGFGPAFSVTAHGDTTAEVEVGVELGDDQSGSGLPGRMVMYTVSLSNQGTYTDTFSLSLGAHAWPTSLSQTSVTLGPGASADVSVAVTVGVGRQDMVVVTATSGLAAEMSDGVTLSTRTYVYFGPIVARR